MKCDESQQMGAFEGLILMVEMIVRFYSAAINQS